jgi:ABC-2 type transport system permease protein
MSHVRREFIKILSQKRTYIGWAFLLAVPVLEVIALYLANAKPQAGEGPPFLASAVHNGLFVPISAIAVLSFFFLPLLSSMAGAFPIAGEAEMGTMKTWLARPVSRGAVVFSKWGVAILYVAIGMALATIGGLVAGGIAFGVHPLVTLSGTTVSIAHGLGLVALANLLILGGMLCILSLALFISSFTNSSLTAAIVATVVFIVLTILNSLSYFNSFKPYTFTAYSDAFTNFFRDPIYWHPIRDALLTYGVTVAVLMVAAWLVFRRRDILT